jgi:dTDP-4-dehydrorhamnose 3,5-epimerase
MPFEFSRSFIPEVMVIRPRLYPDGRGFFMEAYKRSDFAAHGIAEYFVQCNHSRSSRATLRGLHFQKAPKAQGKLVRAVAGEIFDVAVDMRHGSPSYGKWVSVLLSGQNQSMLFIPPGFAHGFCVTSEEADVLYMTTEEYAPECEAGVAWNDPDLGIDWPIDDPQLSERDRRWPRLRHADNNFD